MHKYTQIYFKLQQDKKNTTRVSHCQPPGELVFNMSRL